jgi:hypothetical protein
VQNKSAGSFNPTSVAGLSKKAQDAVKDAFEAMADWRNEVADDSARNTKRVLEKMAVAAATLGWPEQIVDAAREQLQRIAEIQISTMDQMIDAWEDQLKTPLASQSTILSKLAASPNFGLGAANPLQFWMHSVEQWQRLWTDSMTVFWSQAGQATRRRPVAGT